jgi:lipopolysaccharide export system permease protein
MYSLIELSNAKTIPSEIGIVVPVVILFIVAVVQWRRSCSRL